MKIDGSIPDNLYRIWYDPYGIDKDNKTLTLKHSLAGVFVYMLPNNITTSKGDRLVASFIGRRDTLEELDRIVWYLSEYYNAKVLFERNRGETKTNFTKFKALHRLCKEPGIIKDTVLDKESNMLGISINTDLKQKGLLYLKDWLYTTLETEDNIVKYRFQVIHDLPLLKELLQYNHVDNFDRVSAMIIGMYDRQEILQKPIIHARYSNSSITKFFNRKLF